MERSAISTGGASSLRAESCFSRWPPLRARFAGSIDALIAARCIQGVGGALLTPGSLALISAAYTDDAARGKAIGLWSGFSALTSAAGPLIGGWLTQEFSWRYVFVINIPIAIAVLAVLPLVPESRDESSDRHIDVIGATLATLGLGLLVYGLIAMNAGITATAVLIALVGSRCWQVSCSSNGGPKIRSFAAISSPRAPSVSRISIRSSSIPRWAEASTSCRSC